MGKTNMTLQEFDELMKQVWSLEVQSHNLLLKSRKLEEEIYRRAGIECHDREPGFPGWTSKTIQGYRNSPREVLEEMEEGK